jgi:hypothetical protein
MTRDVKQGMGDAFGDGLALQLLLAVSVKQQAG